MLTLVLCSLPTISLSKLEIMHIVRDEYLTLEELSEVIFDIIKNPIDANIHLESFYRDLVELTGLCYTEIDQEIIKYELVQLVKDVSWRYNQYRLTNHTLYGVNLELPDVVAFQYINKPMKVINI